MCRGQLARSLFFTDEGKRVVAVGDEVAIFDADSHALLTHWPIKDGWAGAALSPDGSTLALGGLDPVADPPKGLIRLFDLKTGELRQQISAHAAKVRWLAFSSDGALLASLAEPSFTEGADDILVWNVATAQEASRFARSPNGPPRSMPSCRRALRRQKSNGRSRTLFATASACSKARPQSPTARNLRSHSFAAIAARR